MDFVLLLLMVVFGGGIAAIVVSITAAVNRRNDEGLGRQRLDRETLERTIVETFRLAPAERVAIHLASWADRYAAASSRDERMRLLEMAMDAALARTGRISLSDYRSLIELCFALGFHADALARLGATRHVSFDREAFADERPREVADSMFVRSEAKIGEHLERLGLTRENLSRPALSSAYRRLATSMHPDRFHSATSAEQDEAASQFIRLHDSYVFLNRYLDVESGR
jgi:hypothetical protein